MCGVYVPFYCYVIYAQPLGYLAFIIVYHLVLFTLLMCNNLYFNLNFVSAFYVLFSFTVCIVYIER